MNITRPSSALRAIGCLCLALAALRASAQACGTIQDLGNLGQGTYEATAMSADGEVIIGYYYLGGNVRRAFRWTEATGMQDISMPWGETWATAISSDGSTIVGYGKNYAGLDRAFRWTESAGRQDLGTLGGSTANALAVSADGSVIVGYAANFDGQSRAFRWTAATGMQDLGSLGGGRSEATAVSADGTVVVGFSFDASGQGRAFRWTSVTGMQALDGQDPPSAVYPYAVSADGSAIVGLGYIGTGPFRWTSETGVQAILTSEGSWSKATSVSADGNVVAGPQSKASENWAFRWTPNEGTQLIVGPRNDWITQPVYVSADGSTLIGLDSQEQMPIRWTARGGPLLLFDANSLARGADAISANGDIIVGIAQNSRLGGYFAFRWIKNPADVNNDGFVNALDYDQFAEAFESGDPDADFNSDGFVNGIDYDQFAEAFEAGC